MNRSSAPLEVAPATPRWRSTTTWSVVFHRRLPSSRSRSRSPSPSPSPSLLRVKLRTSHKEAKVGKVAFPQSQRMAGKACTTSMLGSTSTASAKTTAPGSCTSAMMSAARHGSVPAIGRAAILFDPLELGRDEGLPIELK